MRLNLILNLRKNPTVQEIARGVLLRITQDHVWRVLRVLEIILGLDLKASHDAWRC